MSFDKGDYPSFAAKVWFDDLKFCGCGISNDVLGALRDSLQLLADRQRENLEEKRSKPYEQSAWARHTEAMGEKLQAIWTPERVRYLVWYVLTGADLEEHGGSVGGGWPTDKGLAFLESPPILDEEDLEPEPEE